MFKKRFLMWVAWATLSTAIALAVVVIEFVLVVPFDWALLVPIVLIASVVSLGIVWVGARELMFIASNLAFTGMWGIMLTTSLFLLKRIHPDLGLATMPDGMLAFFALGFALALMFALASKEESIDQVRKNARTIVKTTIIIFLMEVGLWLLKLSWGVATNPIIGQDWGRMIAFAIVCVAVVHGFFWSAARLPRVLRF